MSRLDLPIAHSSRLRPKHCLFRVRACNLCGTEHETAEYSFFRDGFHPQDQDRVTVAKADRCRACIIGKGKQIRAMARIQRGFAGPNWRPDDHDGAMIRRRKCDQCGAQWTTHEVLSSKKRYPDVTLCYCGGEMKVKRRFYRVVLHRGEAPQEVPQ